MNPLQYRIFSFHTVLFLYDDELPTTTHVARLDYHIDIAHNY